MIKPKALKPGDVVGLVAPASAIRAEDGIRRSVEAVEALGFAAKLGRSCSLRYGYLAGYDEVRAQDVADMFQNSHVDAIFCLRGGYGSPRILDRLDYVAIARNPKLFVGYSDITALHAVLAARCGLITLHGPMPASDLILEQFTEFSKASLLRALTMTQPLGRLKNPRDEPLHALVGGRAQGILCGGNLTLVTSLLGTPFEIDTRGKILFLEDVGEKTYRIDGMLNHLRLCGKFDDCAGVLLGDFSDCVAEDEAFDLPLEQILTDLIAPAGKPTLLGLRAGHGEDKITLPLGVVCTLDADAGTVTIEEAAVTV